MSPQNKSELVLGPVQPARRLAWAVLFVFGSAQAASCRELVEGENLNAPQTLCEQLNACFGAGDPSIPTCEVLADRLERATEAERTQGLTNFESAGCLENNCGLARACLDLPGFCKPAAEGCARDVDCCGWSVGLTECGPKADGATVCCSNSGVECDSHSDCCGSEQCLTLVGDLKTCGGVKCNPLGEACENSSQCCGQLNCFQGQCQVKDCIEQDGPCKGDTDCCSQTVSSETGAIEIPLFCVEGRCGPKEEECYDETSACNQAKKCCNQDATCQPAADGVSRCSTCTGGGAGVDCSQDSACCSNSCVAIGDDQQCAKPGCEPVGGSCVFPTDCCTGACSAGFCTEPSCITGVCHDPCDVGPPIKDCDVGQATVIEAVPSCGCYWGIECVLEFDAQSEGACGL